MQSGKLGSVWFTRGSRQKKGVHAQQRGFTHGSRMDHAWITHLWGSPRFMVIWRWFHGRITGPVQMRYVSLQETILRHCRLFRCFPSYACEYHILQGPASSHANIISKSMISLRFALRIEKMRNPKNAAKVISIRNTLLRGAWTIETALVSTRFRLAFKFQVIDAGLVCCSDVISAWLIWILPHCPHSNFNCQTFAKFQCV